MARGAVAGVAVVTRQSTEAFCRISLSPVKLHVCAVRTWKYGALFPPRPRIWQPLPLCLGVACGVQGWIRREMPLLCYSSCAMLASTVDTCSWSVLGGFLDELPTFSTARWTRILRFLLVLHTCRMEKCAQPVLQSAVPLLNTTFTKSTSLAVGVMTDGTFRRCKWHFSDSSSE